MSYKRGEEGIDSIDYAATIKCSIRTTKGESESVRILINRRGGRKEWTKLDMNGMVTNVRRDNTVDYNKFINLSSIQAAIKTMSIVCLLMMHALP